jgi:hypothetical protein
MNAQACVKQAADCGVKLTVNGDKITWKARSRPTESILANIRFHKPGIIALLRNNPEIEHESELVAAEIAAMNAVEAQFQAELGELRETNAAIYARPSPWRIKR